MKLNKKIARLVVVGFMALAVSGCATATDRKTTNTVLGAGLGGVAGAVLSDGDPLYTIGGAAAGGLLGNILTEDRRDRGHRHYRGRNHYDHGDRRYVQSRYRDDRRYYKHSRKHSNKHHHKHHHR
jgi:hypothetical protein